MTFRDLPPIGPVWSQWIIRALVALLIAIAAHEYLGYERKLALSDAVLADIQRDLDAQGVRIDMILSRLDRIDARYASRDKSEP
ncbi:MAG: hypothetical protein AAFQ13_12790 [Pseudomonadota bacterium]